MEKLADNFEHRSNIELFAPPEIIVNCLRHQAAGGNLSSEKASSLAFDYRAICSVQCLVSSKSDYKPLPASLVHHGCSTSYHTKSSL